MKFTIYDLIFIFQLLHRVFCLKEIDPKCRYTVHLPEASWYTAYDVCQMRSKTLANISVLADLYMVDLVLKEVDKFTIYQDDLFSSGIWFHEFIRVSNQGNTVETCKSLDCSLPVKTTLVGSKDGMLCLYYNRTDLNIYPEDCKRKKAFICESKNKAPPYESCMETSETSSLKDREPQNLCKDFFFFGVNNAQECESYCIDRFQCYTMMWTMDKCESYRYMDEQTCSEMGRNLSSSLRHKSIFLFNNEDYLLATTKPLAEWCTEPRNDTSCHGNFSVLYEDSWKTYGAKCRYSVRLPEAPWYTSYDVCEQNNQTLAEITSLSEMFIMEDLLNDVDILLKHSVFNVSVGLWIGGFMRTSDKEILTGNCKSLKVLSSIHIPAEEFTEEILCLYYNRTAMKIYTDNCKKTKPFICERKEKDPSSCMETSETSSLKDRSSQKLCLDFTSLDNAKQCESRCIQRSSCYTNIWNGYECRMYRYQDDQDYCFSLERNPPTFLRHKSFFKFSSSDFPVSDPKPFAEWCPEPRKIMILPEKTCNVPTRTTPDDFIISQGWEAIEIFNDLNGDMKSKMAVVFDDNEVTCFPLPTQEDFTPFLMMRMPTESVFGILAKGFTLNISGKGISCNRHSNSRMLQVSYKAIKEPTQFCTLTDNKAVPDAFSSCLFRCDCPDPAHCRDVNLFLASGNAKGAWSLCEVKATNS